MAKKGISEERDLVHKLWDRNFAALRAPASGAATKMPLPDVLAGNGKLYLAIEVKTTSKDKIYISPEQIDGLYNFSKLFGAKPYLAVKFKYKKWLFIEPDKLPRSNHGSYIVKKDFMIERAIDVDELVGDTKQMKF